MPTIHIKTKQLVRFKIGTETSGHWGHAGRPGEIGGSLPKDEATRISTIRLRLGLSHHTLFGNPEWIALYPSTSFGGAAQSIAGHLRAIAPKTEEPKTETSIVGAFKPIPSYRADSMPYAPPKTSLSDARSNALIMASNARDYHGYTASHAEHADVYLAKASDNLNTLIKDAPVVIRANPDDAVSILRDGRFMSQFETEASNGSYNPDYRSVAEAMGLGVPRDVDPTQRPIYGCVDYLPDDEENHGSRHADSYGNIEFVMKDSIKDRTTITVGDSLGNFAQAETVGAPFWSKDKSLAFVDTGALRSIHDNKPDDLYEYIETQIHAGVTMNDVGKIIIHHTEYSGSDHKGDIEEAAKAWGIPIEVVDYQ